MSAGKEALATGPASRVRQVTNLLPGVGLSAVIAMAATTVSILHGGPQFLYALFFGIAFHYLSQETKTRPGIEFCARGVLRLGGGHHTAVRHVFGQALWHDARARRAVGRGRGHLRCFGCAGHFGRAAA